MCTVPSIETFSTYASDVLRDVDYISYYDVLPRRVYCTHSQPSVLRDGRTLVTLNIEMTTGPSPDVAA